MAGYIPDARHRGIILDLLREAKKVPSFAVERWVDVLSLSTLRKKVRSRISWSALMVRAYGRAMRQFPSMRISLQTFPWTRHFQGDDCVVTLAVNRDDDPATKGLYFHRLREADRKSLLEIQAELDRATTQPVPTIFKQQWNIRYAPSWIRRWAWWFRFHVSIKKKQRRFGTGGLSALAGLGTYNRSHPNILTTSLTFGPEEAGRILLTLQCDHRILDGTEAAVILNFIAQELQSTLLRELLHAVE